MRPSKAALVTVIATGCLMQAPFAAAQDPARGKRLYETHCLTCHYERLHGRDRSRSRVQNLAELRVEVANRAKQANVPLTIEDQDNISDYLNASYYKFPR